MSKGASPPAAGGPHWDRILLGLIVLVYCCLAVLYAVKTPPWNNPDEPAHYNYVRHIASTGTLPILEMGDWDMAYLEKAKTEQFPPELSIEPIQYESHQPPLYYVLATPLFLATRSLALPLHVLALRGLNIFFGALLVLLTYRFGLILSIGNRWLALGAAAFVAGLPMQVALTAAINNDVLAELLFTIGLLICLNGLREGFTERRLLYLGIVVGLALLTKTTVYSLAIVAACAIVLRWWLTRRSAQRASLWRQLLLPGVPILMSGVWFIRNMSVYGLADPFGLRRHDAVVLGQPRTQHTLEALHHFLGTSFQSFWGQFGWMSIVLDRRIYLFAGAVTLLAVLGLLIGAWKGRRSWRAPRDWRLAAKAIVVLALLLVAAAFAGYNLTFIQAQGRYLFYAIAPIAVLFVAGWLQLLPRLLAPLVVIAVAVILPALNVLIVIRFIAPSFGT